MPDGIGPPLSDEALDRLARRWFAEARAQHPEEPPGKPADDAAGEAGADLFDWLLGGGGDDPGDAGGD